MEQWLEYCEEHDNLIMAAMGVSTLILGPVLYCVAVNHGKYFDWILTPVEFMLRWLCFC
jgi:hypothetical protein